MSAVKSFAVDLDGPAGSPTGYHARIPRTPRAVHDALASGEPPCSPSRACHTRRVSPRRASTPTTRRPRAARPAFHAYPLVHPHDRAAWRAWLAANHATSPGIWLVFDKKTSRPDRLAYGDAVEEALCFGWIDSLTNKLDAHRYKQLFTPRKPGSNWSGLNKRRIEKVVAAGLMTHAGQAKIDAAKRDGSWTQLDAVEALEMPADLAAALARHRRAAANFAAFPPSARRALLYWVTSARRPDTRTRRVARVVELAAAKQRSPY